MKTISRLTTALSLVALAALPLAASAAGIDTSYITPYSNGIINIINQILVPLILGLSFITFLWGVYKYFILGGANEASQQEGRQYILWGIIGFVVILSVWGIVNLVKSTLSLGSDRNPTPPTFYTTPAP